MNKSLNKNQYIFKRKVCEGEDCLEEINFRFVGMSMNLYQFICGRNPHRFALEIENLDAFKSSEGLHEYEALRWHKLNS